MGGNAHQVYIGQGTEYRIFPVFGVWLHLQQNNVAYGTTHLLSFLTTRWSVSLRMLEFPEKAHCSNHNGEVNKDNTGNEEA